MDLARSPGDAEIRRELFDNLRHRQLGIFDEDALKRTEESLHPESTHAAAWPIGLKGQRCGTARSRSFATTSALTQVSTTATSRRLTSRSWSRQSLWTIPARK